MKIEYLGQSESDEVQKWEGGRRKEQNDREKKISLATKSGGAHEIGKGHGRQ
jgi:hypothetical protein